jgi:hypothetical protein
MKKPLQIPAVVAPAELRLRCAAPPDRAGAVIPITPDEARKVSPRQLVVEHKPGRRGIILLKILAMETHPGNVERLDRRRQFSKRFAAPAEFGPVRQ